MASWQEQLYGLIRGAILGSGGGFLRWEPSYLELCDGSHLPTPVLAAVVIRLALGPGPGPGALDLLFLFRIVLTWYPQIDLSRGAMRLVGAPTEPLLALTRRLIKPIGGVDVTPVVWVGLLSLVREILVGQQGLVSQVLFRAQSVGIG